MANTRIADSASSGRKLPLKALAALFLLAISSLLLLAACGGGDNKEATGTPSGTRAPAATQTTTGTQAPAGTPSAGATQTPAAAATQAATPAPQASGGEIDPCALVTKAEAEAIVGESLGDPVVTNTQMLTSCIYSTPNFDSVGVDVLTYNNEDDAKSGFQLAIDINNYPKIDGIGDGAYDSRPIGDITVRKGKYELSVDVNTDDAEADFQTAKDLAAKAVDRLP